MIRVLVVDDHPMVRRGTCDVLAEDEGLEIVGQGTNGVDALAEVDRLSPDVLVMDVQMPLMDGVEATRKLREKGSAVKILIVSAGGEDEQILQALQVGANGYLLKTAPDDMILKAIHLVANGEPALLQPEVTRALIPKAHAAPAGQGPAADFEALSDRELEVLREVAKDLGNKQVASRLGISDRTVQQHLANIYGKLGVTSRTGAVLKSLHLGLLKLEDCRL